MYSGAQVQRFLSWIFTEKTKLNRDTDCEHLHVALQGLVPTDSTNSVWEFHSSTSSSEIVLSDLNFCLADKCNMAPHCCLILYFPWLLGRLIYMFVGQFGFFSYMNCLFIVFFFPFPTVLNNFFFLKKFLCFSPSTSSWLQSLIG